MNEETAVEQNAMEECAARVGEAAAALERVIGKLEAQYEALNQKIDRIIATVEKQAAEETGEAKPLVEASGEMKAGRRTLAPLVSLLLAKSGVGEGAQAEGAVLDKALAALTVEQRIAVKSELARAGMIA